MVFAASAKEDIAHFYGLPANTFYNYSYADWGRIQKQFIRFTAEAEEAWNNPQMRKTIPQFHSLSKLPLAQLRLGQIWEAFRDYHNSIGQAEVLDLQTIIC